MPQTLAFKTLNKNKTAIKKLNSSQTTANNSGLIQKFHHNTSTSLYYTGDLTNEQGKVYAKLAYSLLGPLVERE